jgi:hypothetical protein
MFIFNIKAKWCMGQQLDTSGRIMSEPCVPPGTERMLWVKFGVVVGDGSGYSGVVIKKKVTTNLHLIVPV